MNPPTAEAATASTAAPPADGLSIDVTAERARTAGSAHASHFNAAGAALPTHGVVSAVVDHLRLEEQKGGYEAAAERRARIDAVYSSAAALVGAHATEIALFDSASTGLRILLDALRPTRGQRIVAATSTYVSHALHLMSLAREHGIDLVIAPYDERRRVDVPALEVHWAPRTSGAMGRRRSSRESRTYANPVPRGARRNLRPVVTITSQPISRTSTDR